MFSKVPASNLTLDGWNTFITLAEKWSKLSLPENHACFEFTKIHGRVTGKSVFGKVHRTGNCRPMFGRKTLREKLASEFCSTETAEAVETKRWLQLRLIVMQGRHLFQHLAQWKLVQPLEIQNSFNTSVSHVTLYAHVTSIRMSIDEIGDIFLSNFVFDVEFVPQLGSSLNNTAFNFRPCLTFRFVYQKIFMLFRYPLDRVWTLDKWKSGAKIESSRQLLLHLW